MVLFLVISCFGLVATPSNAAPDSLRVDRKYLELEFDGLPRSWDEGVPLGNGKIGALVWEKDGRLRMSLDHVYLWDLRPMENLKAKEWSFDWVVKQWQEDTYQEVQKLFDEPYDRSPAPSKIPGAALEFETAGFGSVQKNVLNLSEGVNEIHWQSGVKLFTFINATKNVGLFKFEGVAEGFTPELEIPAYASTVGSDRTDPVTGQDLRRLAYEAGTVVKTDSSVVYNQSGWGDFSYTVRVHWQRTGDGVEGAWTITAQSKLLPEEDGQLEESVDLFGEDFEKNLKESRDWWKTFWSKSSLSIPDEVLMKQWYLEQYKFGCTARSDGPPISLQAVWTADNGKLPPWKGDFHHDLNTQLSYWPSYSANHLDLGKGFLNWLRRNYPAFKKYTEDYFQSGGVNVPGVTTLDGEPMGGWIQYSFGPTVSAWLSHHFYLHWRYSMDRKFLEEEAYPWFRDVAVFLDDISEKSGSGLRKLPISSSPEIHNNSRKAWFGQTTNFDLANIRFVYTKAAELAKELGYAEDERNWRRILSEWPEYAVDHTGLMIAPEEPFAESHRHFSHLMAIHPLGLINWSGGEKSRDVIRKTVENLKTTGSSAWVGYSFSWLGNLQARMLDGDGAAKTLGVFASNFCLPNSFHVNGDQSGKGFSNFTYRPFTLEGNFAFAAGVQEMLIQSHEGFVRLFPAVPSTWTNASFNGFLAEGAFQISAQLIGENEIKAVVFTEKGGTLKIMNPYDGRCLVNGVALEAGEIWALEIARNETGEVLITRLDR